MNSGPLPAGSGSEIERLKSWVAAKFPVYETRLTPQSLILLVHADPATVERQFDALRQDLWERFYIPQLRYERGEYLIEIVRRPARQPWGLLVNVVLLAATIVSTVAAGGFLWVAYVGGSALQPTDFVLGGLTFALPLLLILGVHELAHYVMARRHHVEASLPFFIPVPPPFLLFGTFGAFISLREPIPDKKALLDIGASGPLAGFALSIPITLYGMVLSVHAPILSVANCGPSVFGINYGNFLFGQSLLWELIGAFFPAGLAHLSPVALAGWVGILVTAINLLPAGQLDGGHVFRALLGDRSRYVSYVAVGLLFLLGFFYSGWFLFAVLILVLGMRHPPPLNDLTPLDWKRWAVGFLAISVLISGFVIIPIGTPTGGFTLQNPASSPAPSPGGGGFASNLSMTVSNLDEVDHGFVFNGSVVRVVAGTANGTSQPLNGSALQSYLANSSWTVHLPDGNVSTTNGSGKFSISSTEYATILSETSATVTVTYSNTLEATVTILLYASEVCSGSFQGVGPLDQEFTVF
ncbi:MAG: site-2 protease family protein [Thermoplasmata archaeon]|nr:site-2 protease family protein [Thermoplasmata archaeon]